MIDTPQLAQFLSHTPNLEALQEVCVIFSDSHVTTPLWYLMYSSHRRSDWQLSTLAQVFYIILSSGSHSHCGTPLRPGG